jgi:hypothetical protein
MDVLDHELADDELAWIAAVYRGFSAARAPGKSPKETLREVLGRPEHALPGPMELQGDGPWRNGRNAHGRLVAAVFLKKIELHGHEHSRTDQFPMYVNGEADGFSVEHGLPVLTPVAGGGHFHNAPNTPHAFVPKVGAAVPDDWEIAFIAITPRNLREDTQAVSDATKVIYRQAVGLEAPAGV